MTNPRDDFPPPREFCFHITMPKNKKGHPTLEELLERPWCYYCERDFDDLKILTEHQRHKHFKCERCNKRLHTAGGLSIHLNHVHKEQLGPIENALPNRSSAEIEIFGMTGIPDEVVAAHRQRVITQYSQAEADRRAATGNPTPGGQGPAKKPKFESPAEMKKRLAEHRAKKAEAEAAEAQAHADAQAQARAQADAQAQAQAQADAQAQAHAQAQAQAPPSETAGYEYYNGGFPQPYGQFQGSYQPNFAQHYPPYQAPHPQLPQRPAFASAEAAVPPSTPADEKKKKDKSDARMVYGDNETSPEERMARLPRYAFTRGEAGPERRATR